MPRYTYTVGLCSKCGESFKGFVSTEEPFRNVCQSCTNPYLAVEAAKSLKYFHSVEYYDSGLGCWIKSRGERKRVMKNNDLVCLGDDCNFNYGLEDVPLGKKPDEVKFSKEEEDALGRDIYQMEKENASK